jgi:hypothetical protein
MPSIPGSRGSFTRMAAKQVVYRGDGGAVYNGTF